MAKNRQIEVQNLRAVQRAVRQAGDADLKKGLRKANRDAAKPVADTAKTKAPKRSGALAKSIGAKGSQRNAQVKAGTASRVPYAGPIHFGWPARNIAPQPFLYEALDERFDQVREAYAKALDDIVRQVNRKTSP